MTHAYVFLTRILCLLALGLSSRSALAQPAVTGFSPSGGLAGSVVMVTGTGFTGATGVLFGSVNTPYFTVHSDTRLSVNVPTGILPGSISVVVGADTATSAGDFCVSSGLVAVHDTVCTGSPATLMVTGGAVGQTYAWYDSPTSLTPLAGANDSSFTTPILTATTWYYVGSRGSGTACQYARIPVVAVVDSIPPQPSITSIGTPSTWNGPNLVSSAPAGNQWYLYGSPLIGETDTLLHTMYGGIYTVVVTTPGGCVSPMSAGLMVVIASIRPSMLAAQVAVFPNPTTGQVQLTLPGAARVTVLNALGQPVLTPATASNSIALDLTGLARGVYAVRVQLGSEVVVKRVVLQ